MNIEAILYDRLMKVASWAAADALATEAAEFGFDDVVRLARSKYPRPDGLRKSGPTRIRRPALEKQAAEQRLVKAAADLSQRLAKVSDYESCAAIMKEAGRLAYPHGHDVYMAALDKWSTDVKRKLDMIEKQNRDWGIGPKAPSPEVLALGKAQQEFDVWRGGAGGENPFNRTLHKAAY
jgi:hypothetical protein